MFDEFVNIVRHPTILYVERGTIARVLKSSLCKYNRSFYFFFYNAFCKMQYYMMQECIFYSVCGFDLNNQRFEGEKENYFNWHQIFLSSSAAVSIFLIFHILRYAVKPKIDWSNINQLYVNDLEYKNRKTHAKSKKNGQNIILLRGNEMKIEWVSVCVMLN